MTICIVIFAICFFLDWTVFPAMPFTTMATWSGRFPWPIRVLFIAGFRTWNLLSVFFRGMGCWLTSDFSNPCHTWISIFFESHLKEITLWQSSANFWRVNTCSFSSLVSTRRLTSASSAHTKPCTNIKHLKSSAVSSANLKSLQSLFTDAANVRKSCWLSLTVFRHFQR